MAEDGVTTLPRRADARRNRERVLAAARGALAAEGLETSMEEVARRAAVGVGTVYRHFPTKEAVVDAIAAEHFTALAEAAAAAEHADEDPWTALTDFLRRAAALQAGDVALAEIMAARPEHLREAALRRSDLYAAVARLIDGAQASGALRPDVRPADIPMLLCGTGRALRLDEAESTEWERYLGIVIDGLRAPGTSPLSR